jgi:hypothetical protein
MFGGVSWVPNWEDLSAFNVQQYSRAWLARGEKGEHNLALRFHNDRNLFKTIATIDSSDAFTNNAPTILQINI